MKLNQHDLERIRHKGRTDLYYLAKRILGYKDLNERLHRWLCNIVQGESCKNRLFLLPRGHFKTSIVTIAHTIFKLLNDANHRILVIMSTQLNARKVVKEIKAHLTNNPVFRMVYPEYCPMKKGEFGTSERITVPNRTKILKECSVEAFGVGAKVVGAHYDSMKKDDLIDEKTVLTSEQIEKIVDWDKISISLFENPEVGHTDYVATRFHYDDLSGHIIANRPDVKVYLRRAIEDGQPIFPERFTVKGLEQIKRDQGSSIFSCQYMNEPLDSDSALFKKQWFRYWKELPKKRYTVMAVDPSVTDTKKDDPSGMVVVSADANGKMYVEAAYNLRCTPKDLVNRIYIAAYQFKPKKIALEAYAFQKSFKYFIDAEQRRYKKRLPIVEITSGTRIRKYERIQALQPFFERGDLLVHETQTDLIEQLMRYPMTKNDDLLDALSYTLQILRRPIKSIPQATIDALASERRFFEVNCPQSLTTGYY